MLCEFKARVAAIAALIFVVGVLWQTNSIDNERTKAVTQNIAASVFGKGSQFVSKLDEPAWPYAYATFLTEGANYTTDLQVHSSAPFFHCARILTYQLLHAPSTRTRHKIPFIVLVTPAVPQSRRDRLTKDGATVVEAEPIMIDWMDGNMGLQRWADVATKMHLINMTQFERIAFIDADHLLRARMDGIFETIEVAHPRKTGFDPEMIASDEAPLPEDYVFAAAAELNDVDHPMPPDPTIDYPLNGGFWVVKPDTVLFNYYISVLQIPDRFFIGAMEQSMLNYAHRTQGNMPWHKLDYLWNANSVNTGDLEAGVKSLHGKWWMKDEIWNQYDRETQRNWRLMKKEMEQYYEEREGERWRDIGDEFYDWD